jgi:hypothetical protein
MAALVTDAERGREMGAAGRGSEAEYTREKFNERLLAFYQPGSARRSE